MVWSNLEQLDSIPLSYKMQGSKLYCGHLDLKVPENSFVANWYLQNDKVLGWSDPIQPPVAASHIQSSIHMPLLRGLAQARRADPGRSRRVT